MPEPETEEISGTAEAESEAETQDEIVIIRTTRMVNMLGYMENT